MLCDKLNKNDNLILENYINQTFDKSLFLPIELLDDITRISGKYNMEICIMLSRKGHVIDVSVGNSERAKFEAVEGKSLGLSGVRLIHTHPGGNFHLSDIDISALKNNRLDAICSIGVENGNYNSSEIAFFNGNSISKLIVDNPKYINKSGLFEKILENEKAYFLNHVNEQNTDNITIIAKLVMDNKCQINNEIIEIKELCKTAQLDVRGTLIQHKSTPDGKYFLGEGKLNELKELVQLNDAQVVVFDNQLMGSKLSNLSNFLGVKVIDRNMLILDIFAGRARTSEGKLQVELAQLKYLLPRLGMLSQSSGKYGGGVGMRGPGETKLELNRRVVETNIERKSNELKKLRQLRDNNRKNRIANSKPVVAIVGYTNSGKSSLLNLLAKDNIFVKDELFATLDTTTRNVWLGQGKEILLSDTVGFINNLPHEFIEAFGSTLEECKYANLILHVVDISNQNYEKHIEVTNEVLKSIGCEVPVIMVYNKIDNLQEIPTINHENSIYISVLKSTNIEKLKEMIAKKLFN